MAAARRGNPHERRSDTTGQRGRPEGRARDPDHAAGRGREGVEGLSSLAFFIAFATLSTLFVLKDGPVMHRFINRHLAVPEPIADVVTTNVAKSLRSYFLGVTIIAAINGVIIGLAALILGVPLAGTIAVVTFVAAYVPFVGAWVAGAFAVLIALGSQGTTDALILGVAALLANGVLQQLIQPFVMGAHAGAQPARGARRHHRRRRPVRDGWAHAGRAADLRGGAHQQRAARPERPFGGGRAGTGAIRLSGLVCCRAVGRPARRTDCR
jgi:AI-2E family transporter